MQSCDIREPDEWLGVGRNNLKIEERNDCFQKRSMATMRARPTPDQAVYTPSTSKLALSRVRAKESKVRLRTEKTTSASAGRRFANPCESFKEAAAASSEKSANMRNMPFMSDLLSFRGK